MILKHKVGQNIVQHYAKLIVEQVCSSNQPLDFEDINLFLGQILSMKLLWRRHLFIFSNSIIDL